MEKITQLANYKPKVHSGPTSMVTLIIPSSMNLDDVRFRMKKERQTAVNIKSNTNRKSVMSSLGRIHEYLKRVKTLPSTGLALYSEQYI